jgi:hypothetical protein
MRGVAVGKFLGSRERDSVGGVLQVAPVGRIGAEINRERREPANYGKKNGGNSEDLTSFVTRSSRWGCPGHGGLLQSHIGGCREWERFRERPAAEEVDDIAERCDVRTCSPRDNDRLPDPPSGITVTLVMFERFGPSTATHVRPMTVIVVVPSHCGGNEPAGLPTAAKRAPSWWRS